LVLTLFSFTIFLAFLRLPHLEEPATSLLQTPEFHISPNTTKLLVVSSRKKDDTSWIDKFLPDWEYVRYVTDQPGEYTIPKNKGNEAMVYLTFV
jgi:hypothetical protein